MKKQEIIEAQLIKRKPAKNVTQKDSSLFEHELEKNISNVYVLELSTVYLLNGYLLDLKNLKNFRTYNLYTHTYSVTKKRNLLNIGKIILSNLSLKTKEIKNAVLATDSWSEGYFHWLTDVAPRILVAQKSKKYQKDTELLISKKLEDYDFVQVTAKKINQKLFFYEESQVYKIKTLILPSHVAESGNYNRKLMQKIRELFTKKLDRKLNQVAGRKIYISRQKSRYRKINNENEVQNLLKKYDYEIHYFEEYGFEKQIELMQETVSLVGLHGAGLTNMLFMNPKTNVLEIRNQEDKHNNCYFSLASDLDINYYYLLSKGDSSETHAVNIDVDINELEQIILKMKK